MDPTSNNKNIPPVDPGWESQKKPYSTFWKNETFSQIARGVFLGGWTTMILNPGLYAVNMAMIKQQFVLKDSFRGVFLNAANVVPQTAVQVTVYKIVRELLFPNKKDDELSLPYKFICSGVAGGASGLVTATGEMAVLHYQKQKVVKHTIKQIVSKAYQSGGIARCNTGALALGCREMTWATSYLVLASAISNLYSSVISNKNGCDFLGAATAGAVAGILTNPANYLRAQKQREALNEAKPRSYRQIIMQEGTKELFRGVPQRILVTSAACVIITAGNKLLNRIF